MRSHGEIILRLPFHQRAVAQGVYVCGQTKAPVYTSRRAWHVDEWLLTLRNTRPADNTREAGGRRLGSTQCRRRRDFARSCNRVRARHMRLRTATCCKNEAGATHSLSNLLTRSHLSPTKNDVNSDSCTSAATIDIIATCNRIKAQTSGGMKVSHLK
jgi:hypothetical protein